MARTRRQQESDLLPIVCLVALIVSLMIYVVAHTNAFILVIVFAAGMAVVV